MSNKITSKKSKKINKLDKHKKSKKNQKKRLSGGFLTKMITELKRKKIENEKNRYDKINNDINNLLNEKNIDNKKAEEYLLFLNDRELKIAKKIMEDNHISKVEYFLEDISTNELEELKKLAKTKDILLNKKNEYILLKLIEENLEAI